MKQLSTTLMCLALCLSVAACSAATAEAASVVNTSCPVSGKAIEDGSTGEFNGETVGFCCDDCIAEWDGMSDEDKTAALTDAD